MKNKAKNIWLVITAALILPVSLFTDTRAESWLPSTQDPQSPILQPDPYVSIAPPGHTANMAAWKAEMRQKSALRAAGRDKPKTQIKMNGAGVNRVTGLGTAPGLDQRVLISTSADLPEPAEIATAEENGSLSTATPTFLQPGEAVTISSIIGDGEFGATTGDFDIFRIDGVSVGQTISTDIVPGPGFVPVVVLFDSNGIFFGIASLTGFSWTASFPGDFYILVGGADTFTPDITSPGNGFGAGLTGSYDLTIGLEYFGVQEFVFSATKGDVIGAAVNGDALAVGIRDKQGVVRMGSSQDVTTIAPEESPLPSGSASAAWVADEAGQVTVVVAANGEYELELTTNNPDLDSGDRGRKQIIFIDFDGGTFNIGETLNSFPFDIDVTLSPLSSFLPDWGLEAADEDAVIDAILGEVEWSLRQDLIVNGGAPRFDVEILNSRDHEDPFGQPDVSRVIVGGTIPELRINTIGIAGSIDPGNFGTTDTAYVLLDVLSGRLPTTLDLDQIPRAPGVSVFDIIGVGVGEIVAHEAGHYLGNFHTDQFNPTPNIMDQGGNLEQSILGLGPDGVFGTSDDVEVMFVRDVFVPSEGLAGEEDSASLTAWGMTTPRGKGRNKK